MKFKIKSFAILTVIFFLISGSAFANKSQQKFRLGFIAPFSGMAQVYGDAAKNGFELALVELGKDWLDVIYEDDQFTPAKTVAAFHKLTSVNKVHAVVCVGSTQCNAVAQLAQRQSVPLLAWASDIKVSKGRSYIMRTYPSGHNEGQRVAKEAIQRKADKVALIISINDYSDSWGRGFKEYFPTENILMIEEVSKSLLDFRSIALKAKAHKVLQFSICLDPGQSSAFAKHVHQVIPQAQIFGCESLHDSSEVAAAGGALDKAWFATISVTSDFNDKYVKKFGTASVISGAAVHYDLAYLLHDNKLQAVNTENLIMQLVDGKKRQGAVGTFSVLETDDDRFFDINLKIQRAK